MNMFFFQLLAQEYYSDYFGHGEPYEDSDPFGDFGLGPLFTIWFWIGVLVGNVIIHLLGKVGKTRPYGFWEWQRVLCSGYCGCFAWNLARYLDGGTLVGGYFVLPFISALSLLLVVFTLATLGFLLYLFGGFLKSLLEALSKP